MKFAKIAAVAARLQNSATASHGGAVVPGAETAGTTVTTTAMAVATAGATPLVSFGDAAGGGDFMNMSGRGNTNMRLRQRLVPATAGAVVTTTARLTGGGYGYPGWGGYAPMAMVRSVRHLQQSAAPAAEAAQ